jgi:ubiquitin C-terminal hydrolase
MKKISTKVIYPENNLQIRETCSGKICKYSLSGVVNHHGNLFNGHYTTNVKVNDKWYFIDDDVITESNNINISQSYILFYSFKNSIANRTPVACNFYVFIFFMNI